MTNKGIVTAAIVAVGSVALVPAFAQAVEELNFSVIKYGDELSVAMDQLPLLLVMFGALFLLMEVTRLT